MRGEEKRGGEKRRGEERRRVEIRESKACCVMGGLWAAGG